jgi:hypothetical protein
MDPNNSVVKLCALGIGEELTGNRKEAAKLYQQAWDSRTNDEEACIAAHYVARLQSTPAEALHWNSEALRFAQRATGESTREFFPSLYLNLGKSHEDLGNFARARKFYSLAGKESGVLPSGDYADTVRRGAQRGLKRVKRTRNAKVTPIRAQE